MVAVYYIFKCSASYTLHNKREKSVSLVKKDKKNQVTRTLTVTMSGMFSPIQMINEINSNVAL